MKIRLSQRHAITCLDICYYTHTFCDIKQNGSSRNEQYDYGSDNQKRELNLNKDNA